MANSIPSRTQRTTCKVDLLPKDTSLEAARVYYASLRRMTHEQRLMRTMELIQQTWQLREAYIRTRHPDWDDTRVNRELRRLNLGPALFKKVYPNECDES